jgi:hypothetical protein
MVIKRTQSSETQRPEERLPEGARLSAQVELRPRPRAMHRDPHGTADAGIAEIARPSIFEMMGIDALAPPRPRCPECDMRMVATAGRHECLRCGHVQRKPRA